MSDFQSLNPYFEGYVQKESVAKIANLIDSIGYNNIPVRICQCCEIQFLILPEDGIANVIHNNLLFLFVMDISGSMWSFVVARNCQILY